MRILTDCPDALAAWRPASGWRRESLAACAEAERSLWGALAGAAMVWTGRRPGTGRASFWSLLLALTRAPDSQFDVLRRLLKGGLVLPGPVACLALDGRGFHGHHGRSWVAAAGNLHMSVAFDAKGIPARESATLTMLPAVAVVEGIARASGGALQPGIKWINDVVIAGRKVAGVLTATQVSGEQLTGAVLGIGVNVGVVPDVAPTPFVPAVGSLAAAGVELALAEVLEAILDSLAWRLEELQAAGPRPLHEAYVRASVVIGRPVAVFQDSRGDDPSALSPLARGVVRDIGPDLSLRLEGLTEPVRDGRLAVVEE
jgi:biotin-[acetyl-CoA-carboxylase] ligase BirA-like protein